MSRTGSRRGRESDEGPGFDDNVVKVYRCSKVVKGGRRFSFAALVVVGDRNGNVGVGYGKANEVPNAVDKGRKQATRQMHSVRRQGTTIPHRVTGHFGASQVLLIPAPTGTGVIAGSSVRAVLELAGIGDCLTKVYGSTSPKNLVKATLGALQTLRDRAAVEKLRGVSIAAS
ncbi:MAG TPA: 30S ribosomal protein S5 [Phycisphaerae bacterium]|nr:30S ribosomal protein S5 [Phycisphaerae bacterium]